MGGIERFKYGYDNSYMFYQLGEIVYQYDDLTVFKVNPAATY